MFTNLIYFILYQVMCVSTQGNYFTGLTPANAYIHKSQETVTNIEATITAKDFQPQVP